MEQEFNSIVLRREAQNNNPTVCLKPEEGLQIKRLLISNGRANYARYCKMIGMIPSNFHAILSGKRPCTVEVLNRILSGIRFEALISTTILIQAIPIGEDVIDASYLLDESTSLSDEMVAEELDFESQLDLFLSGKPQEQPKTEQESHLQDTPEES